MNTVKDCYGECILLTILSSLNGRTNDYTDFYLDWAIELFSNVVSSTILIASTSIYIGLFLYINAMVKDMKMRNMSIGSDSMGKPPKASINLEKWSIYVQYIEFHVEIIGYAQYITELTTLLPLCHVLHE